jgi:His/Glu/Gln/Arg/opine family amino acid ABC transporter permease subunit
MLSHAVTFVPILSSAALETVKLTAAILLVSTLLGFGLTLLSFSPVRLVARFVWVYSWLVRSTPQLILLYAAFYGAGAARINVGSFAAAVLALSLYAAAYNYEILRGGFLGLDRGQTEAARALGLSPWHTLRFVTLPQVIAIVIPPYLTNATAVLKGTALASVVAVTEITGMSNRLIGSTNRPFEVLVLAASLYFILNSLLLGAQLIAERRFAERLPS